MTKDIRNTPSPAAEPAILSVLSSPAESVPDVAPVETRVQRLPFDALTWENFERLCHRLIAADGDVEYCARYGRQGEAQEGIDIFARQSDGRYHCLQAKKHKSFGASKLRDAVDLYLGGSWPEKSARLTISIQSSSGSTSFQKEAEKQSARLAERGIQFLLLDGDMLTERLRAHAELIDDFFGRNWVAALLGPDAAARLGARLDGAAFARVRAQLALVYAAQFQYFDPGNYRVADDDGDRRALTLPERFLRPDILFRERARPSETADIPEAAGTDTAFGTPTALPMATGITAQSASTVRRLGLNEWIADGQQMVVVGDAGTGKSTLLRLVALDLLNNHGLFPELSKRWGQYLPIYIPFARWSAQVARDQFQIGIKEIVRRTLEPLLTNPITDLVDSAIDDRRIVLLVDGLDEWSNEQAARSTLGALVTSVEAHGMAVIVSGRPRGLDRIGSLPAHWKRGTIASLSVTQQTAIAGRWFERYAISSATTEQVSEGRLRTERFMAELARDPTLGSLASVPLLLVGLITLSLRGQILPRTKSDIYDQLVRVLLEHHPVSRATAAGDTEPRYRPVVEPESRRAAIARLAFAIRERTGGGSLPAASAATIISDFLGSPDGLDLAADIARAASKEILSVNSETQGLLIEKTSGEVGFVHASFEEYLGAEHISSWPYVKIEEFVRTNAGQPRWRNVIGNLIAALQRRDEIDRLVAIVEEPEGDELQYFYKRALLGDIAFSAVGRSPATARRLAQDTMRRVEIEDWLPARQDALASVLKGLADPALKEDVQPGLRRWLPARISHRSSLISSLGEWKPSDALRDGLWKALHDEDAGVRRSAAATYARVFGKSPDAADRLVNALAHTRDIDAAAAMLEALALGWPKHSEAASLFEEAYSSHAGDLRVTGILGLASIGCAPGEVRDILVRGQNFWSNLSYPHRELASALLRKYWPGDDMLVAGALDRVTGSRNSPWEHDVAISYLLESPTDRADVRSWMLDELKDKFPFHAFGDNRIWSNVGRFAEADPEIRAAANAWWCKPDNRIINMHKIPSYTAYVADEPVARAMRDVIEGKGGMDRHWAVSALVSGWDRHDPAVATTLDALAVAPTESLVDIVAALPDIITDKAMARSRLLELGARDDTRRDLLAIGLESCGCDGSDEEAVSAIMRVAPEAPRFDPSFPLFRAFRSNPRVRALARQRLLESDGPAAAIAAAYIDDPEFAGALLVAATPLHTELRSQTIEVAAAGASGTALETVLAEHRSESDPELRARMTVAHLRGLGPAERDTAIPQLIADLLSVRSNAESVRAAALAGLATIEKLDASVAVEERGKPLRFHVGTIVKGFPAVERAVCEHFGAFEECFGDGLQERFVTSGERNPLPAILAAAPAASPAARAAFLRFAANGQMPRTPDALRALAGERPSSDLLAARCFEALDDRDGPNSQARTNAEIGLILHEQFPGNSDIRARLEERYHGRQYLHEAATLAAFAPESELLSLVTDPAALGQDFADWAVAIRVASRKAGADEFCALAAAMVTRRWRSEFDAQALTNLAIEQRLRDDPMVAEGFGKAVDLGEDPGINGSFIRYLARAGRLDPDVRSKAVQLLKSLAAEQRLPRAGYDAVGDRWRGLRATLLDALASGFEVS